MIRATFDAHAFTLENTEEIQNLTRGCLEPFIFASESDPVLVGSINNGDFKDSIKDGQYILNNRYGVLAIVDAAAVITPLLKED